MAWDDNKVVVEGKHFITNIWKDLRDLLRLMISGLLARWAVSIVAMLLGDADRESFIHRADQIIGSLVFLVFLIVGLASFVIKSYYNLKKDHIESRSEYERQKRISSKYVDDGVDNLPGKAREVWHDAAKGLDDFDPEDE
ncbi:MULTISPECIES: hypothetical protein [Bacillus cereus group]|uniref:hypothetical protein n=1 Tax=Bacillus cereus group TaxID=86661 RepID=UPI0001DA5FDE|nr:MULTISPECIES: hypothetical protein [Bacillus cereus group]EFI64693.1 hypothetical protein BCSJ1_14890 [Bacillus cereus SJ1]MEC4696069.1 hypothetical protein [Bacillus anthracis]